MKNFVVFLLIAAFFTGFFGFSLPEAKAIDPVTIAILAPIALKAAQVASPYIIKGLKNMGVSALKTVPDFFDLLKLPIGLGLVMFGWPFGGVRLGCSYLIKGGLAPFKLTFHLLMIPVSAFGININ